MNEIFTESVSIILYLLQGFLLVWYILKFLPARYVKGSLKVYLPILIYAFLREAIQLIWQIEIADMRMTLAKQVLVIFLLYLFISGFYLGSRPLKVFLTISFSCISEICIMLVIEIMQLSPILFDWYIFLYEKGEISDERLFKLIDYTAFGMQIFMDIIFALILYLLLKLIVKYFPNRREDMDIEGALYITSPCLLGLLIAYIFRGTFYKVEDNIPTIIYDEYPFLYVLVPAVLALILLGMVMNIIIYQRIIIKSNEAMQATLLTKQIEAMEEHFKEIELANENNRRLRHDMKNIVGTLLANENADNISEEWQEYLKDFLVALDGTKEEISTGNKVIDSLLTMKLHEAKERIPDTKIGIEDFILPNNLKIHSYDLCIILGNAIDNAIEACEKIAENRYIYLSSEYKNGMLLIQIKNSFDGRIKTTLGQHFPLSSKEDKENHGMGMENINRIADKYLGGVYYRINDNEFVLNLMLQDKTTRR